MKSKFKWKMGKRTVKPHIFMYEGQWYFKEKYNTDGTMFIEDWDAALYFCLSKNLKPFRDTIEKFWESQRNVIQ